MAIKKSVVRAVNTVLATLLALLGFSGCESLVVEYGVPNADYTIKGTVVDKANAKPIKGIRIGINKVYPGPVMMYGVIPEPYRGNLAVTTDLDGAYNLTTNFTISEIPDDVLPVYVQDIDGDENGLYNDTVLNVDFENATQSGKKRSWYKGEYTKDIKIELTKKTGGNE